jgi:hypothetical protein
MIKKYYNNFIRYMNYNPESSGTLDYWYNFDKEFRENAPIRHFIMRGPVRKAWTRISFTLKDMFYFIYYRTIFKRHVIKLNIPPGYYDTYDLILEANFHLLVKYVEVECALAHSWDYEREKQIWGWKRFLPWFLRKTTNLNPKYATEFGIAHLEWEVSLGDTSPLQAKTASEVLKLYDWWVNVRPKREFPETPREQIEAEEESDYFLYTMTEEWKEKNPEQHKVLEQHYDDIRKLEEEWEKEDKEMLIRLMEIRYNLWK